MAKKSAKKAAKKTSKPAGRKAAAVKTGARKTLAKTGSTQSAKTTSTSKPTSRVVEYKLFTEDSVRNLEDQVNYYIKKGWAPVGGVVLQGHTFMQTMVRHEG